MPWASNGARSSGTGSATAARRTAPDRRIAAACTWPISPRPISPTAPGAGDELVSTGSRALAHGDSGDRFDFDQLVGVAEHGHPEQGARRIVLAERGLDHLPGGDEIGPLGRGDE